MEPLAAKSSRSGVLQLLICATCHGFNRLPAQQHRSERPRTPGGVGPRPETSHGIAGALAQGAALCVVPVILTKHPSLGTLSRDLLHDQVRKEIWQICGSPTCDYRPIRHTSRLRNVPAQHQVGQVMARPLQESSGRLDRLRRCPRPSRGPQSATGPE